MKLRTPSHIFIPLTLVTITICFMMIAANDTASVGSGILAMLTNLVNTFLNVLTYGFYWAIVAVSLVMLFIINSINKMVESKKFDQLSEEQKLEYLAKKKNGYLKTVFLSGGKRQSEKEEQSIILDHSFDGIVELDNSLPQWWLSLFYFGIAFMVVYMLAYGFTNFANPILEYEEESVYLEDKFAQWIEDNDIGMESAVNKYEDQAILDAGKETYNNVCATCHTINGGGATGPNLTDDYWVNQGQESLYYNIYDVVYNGSPNNPAMKAFGQTGELTGLDIEAVSSYVYYMNQILEDVTEEKGGQEPKGTLPIWHKGEKNQTEAKPVQDDKTSGTQNSKPTEQEVKTSTEESSETKNEQQPT